MLFLYEFPNFLEVLDQAIQTIFVVVGGQFLIINILLVFKLGLPQGILDILKGCGECALLLGMCILDGLHLMVTMRIMQYAIHTYEHLLFLTKR